MENGRIVRLNAKINAWSTASMNLGSGLVAALAYRLFVERKIDLTTAAWILVAGALMLAGHSSLSLLEAETEE